jgi:hypothetical protein
MSQIEISYKLKFQRREEETKEKYATNFTFRGKVIEKNRRKYRRFCSLKNKMKTSSIMKYASSPLFRHTLQQNLRDKYRLIPSVKHTQNEQMNFFGGK